MPEKDEEPKFDSPIYHKEVEELPNKTREVFYVMPESFLKFAKNMMIAWSVVGFIGLIIFVAMMLEFSSGHYPSRFIAALEALAAK